MCVPLSIQLGIFYLSYLYLCAVYALWRCTKFHCTAVQLQIKALYSILSVFFKDTWQIELLLIESFITEKESTQRCFYWWMYLFFSLLLSTLHWGFVYYTTGNTTHPSLQHSRMEHQQGFLYQHLAPDWSEWSSKPICCYETLIHVLRVCSLLSWQQKEQEAGLRAPWRSSLGDGLSMCGA